MPSPCPRSHLPVHLLNSHNLLPMMGPCAGARRVGHGVGRCAVSSKGETTAFSPTGPSSHASRRVHATRRPSQWRAGPPRGPRPPVLARRSRAVTPRPFNIALLRSYDAHALEPPPTHRTSPSTHGGHSFPSASPSISPSAQSRAPAGSAASHARTASSSMCAPPRVLLRANHAIRSSSIVSSMVVRSCPTSLLLNARWCPQQERGACWSY